MFKHSIWIYISLALAVIFGKANSSFTDAEKELLRNKWNECCKKNKCIDGTCYIVEHRVSTWAAVRQRCQSHYPDWPSFSDIFQIRKENDVIKFWDMLNQTVDLHKEIPKTVWTSGARCPQTISAETRWQSLWTSTKEPLPSWLNERIKGSGKDANGCEFLVISLAPDNKDVEYEFQDQNTHHSAICEFSPDVIETDPPKPPTDASTIAENVSSSSTTQPPTKPSSPSSLKTTVTTKVLKTDSHSSEKSTTDATTWSSTSSSPKYCKDIFYGGISWPRTLAGTFANVTCPGGMDGFATWYCNENSLSFQPASPNMKGCVPRYCEPTTASGINWPKTLAGRTANVSCPDGMNGLAMWYCDEKSLSFRPERRPNIENCVHKWIDELGDNIRQGHDSLDISRKLAEETKKNVSHGDIIALVSVTSSLLQLYMKQKREEEFEVHQDKEEIFIYYNFTKNMVTSISNILRSEIKDAWEGLDETRQTREASTILKLVTTVGTDLSCIKKSDETLQFTVSEDNIDLQTFILNKTDEANDVIVFPQENEKVKSNSTIRVPANLQLEEWISPCGDFNAGVGIIYKQVGDFLKEGQLNGSSEISTKVLSFSLSNTTESISLSGEKVNISLQHILKNDGKIRSNPRCVFWNFSKSDFGAWDHSGCRLLSFNETHTECQCSHLTNFAVLMDVRNNTKHDKILEVMTYVCCGVSSFALILTIICFLTIRSLHGRRGIITGNLSFTLLMTNMLVLFGLDKTGDKVLCSVIAGLLHYWLLSAFCWMLVEGYHLYRMVVLVFQRGSNLPVKFYYAFAYGFPLLIVGITAAVASKGYYRKDYCWLSQENGVMWSFVGPACTIICVNFVIFILTLRSASSVKIKREQSTIIKIKSWIRGSISVMCLLGLTWCVGLFYIAPELHFFSYIFTVLNGLQGVFIFFFHILLNDKVNNLCPWSSSKDSKKFGRRKFLNHTSSNQTNSKTSTRTSMNSTGGTSSTRLPDSRKQSAWSILRHCHLSHGEVAVINPGNSNKNGKILYPSLENGVRRQASVL